VEKLIVTITGIPNEWRLAAFAIAGILLIILKRVRKPPAIAWAAVFAILMIGVTPFFASLYALRSRDSTVYRIRVTVLDPQNVPVENATVWSSLGGEPKKVPGGWEFDLPYATKPLDGNLMLYASAPERYLRGSRRLKLSADPNPAAEITLEKDSSATVRGQVVSPNAIAIPGARVEVIGYDSESVTTGPAGDFVLLAHSAAGEEVGLHVEKLGYHTVNQLHPAGESPATVVLDRQ